MLSPSERRLRNHRRWFVVGVVFGLPAWALLWYAFSLVLWDLH